MYFDKKDAIHVLISNALQISDFLGYVFIFSESIVYLLSISN